MGAKRRYLVLRQVTRIVIWMNRDKDIIGRWSGANLFILMPDTGSSEAAEVCQNYVIKLARWNNYHKVTTSISINR